MKLLFDFLPIIFFFVTYKVYNIYIATAVAILISSIQVAVFWLKFRRLEKMHLAALALVLVLGGATLLLRDEMFIKWKPTIVNWLFASVFFVSQFIGPKPLIQRIMENTLTLPPSVWQKLNLSWVIFFLLLGIINLYIIYFQSTDFWVNFRLFGGLGLTLLFVIGQAVYLARYLGHTIGKKDP